MNWYYNPWGYTTYTMDTLRVTAPLGTVSYIVKPGDTLFSIASYFNTTVANILRFNYIPNPNTIYVGQTIIIPESPAEAMIYTVQKGDTLYNIARRYGTQVATIMAFNYLLDATIYPGQQLVVPMSMR